MGLLNVQKESVHSNFIEKYSGSTSLLIAHEAEAASIPSICFIVSRRNVSTVKQWATIRKLLKPERYSDDGW